MKKQQFRNKKNKKKRLVTQKFRIKKCISTQSLLGFGICRSIRGYMDESGAKPR